MQPAFHQLLLLGITWIGYFGVHSLMASLTVKRHIAERWPRLLPAYRLGFNAAAVLAVLPPLVMMHQWRGPLLWQWQGLSGWLVDAMALAAAAGFLYSLRHYDGSEFLGLRQLRTRQQTVEDQETFHISPLHRFVRHPWYTLALVIVWTRDMDATLLLTAVLITLYFVLGSRLEERKLLVYHGAVYDEYRRRVPGLMPRPWRFLDRDTAYRLSRDTES